MKLFSQTFSPTSTDMKESCAADRLFPDKRWALNCHKLRLNSNIEITEIIVEILINNTK